MPLLSYFEHFVLADNPVVVDVVECEGPHELVLRRAVRDDREELHEVAESDTTGALPKKEKGFLKHCKDYALHKRSSSARQRKGFSWCNKRGVLAVVRCAVV